MLRTGFRESILDWIFPGSRKRRSMATAANWSAIPACVQQLEQRAMLTTLTVTTSQEFAAALNAAVDGDIIVLGPGTFVGNVTLSAGITIRGSGSSQTTLQGDLNVKSPVIRVSHVSGAVIEDLTISNGMNGGIEIVDASLTIQNNTIEDNIRESAGSAIDVRGNSSIHVLNNIITDNKHYTGPGHSGGWGAIYDASSGDSLYAWNFITRNDSWNGGAIYLVNSSPIIHGNTITHNVGDFHGGIQSSGGHPTIENNVIAGNGTDYQPTGAGISIYSGSANISFNTITDNEDQGVYVAAGATAVIRGNIISENQHRGIVVDGVATLDSNDVFGHEQNYVGSSAIPDARSLSVDPVLNPDYGLGSNSPVINQGPLGFLDLDGTASDMGASAGRGTRQAGSYGVSTLVAGNDIEQRFEKDGFHFTTVLTTNGILPYSLSRDGHAVIVRVHPDLQDINGFGHSWYVNSFMSGGDAEAGSVTDVIATAAGIYFRAAGNVVNNALGGSAGTWMTVASIAYDAATQLISGRGTQWIDLDAPLSAGPGDLNVFRIATNRLVEVPLVNGETGNTGDVDRVEFQYAGAVPPGGTWYVESGNYFPIERSTQVTTKMLGTTNLVDSAAMGDDPIATARKPGIEVTLTSREGSLLSFGGTFDTSQSQNPYADNAASLFLVHRDAPAPQNLNFDFSFTSQPPVEVTVSVAPANVTEDGPTNLAYTLRRTGATNSPLTINAIIAGSASLNADYLLTGATISTPTSATVTFAAGASTATIIVNPLVDAAVETSETVILKVGAGSDYSIGKDSIASGTILDDDAAISIAATSALKSEGQSGNSAFTFMVTRTGSTSGVASALFAVTGTGSDPANATDFGGTFPAGTVTFSAGQSVQSITILVAGDTAFEQDEDFLITLFNPSAGVTLSTATAGGSILNDDHGPVFTSTAIPTISENTTSVLTVTATDADLPAQTITFTITGGADQSKFAITPTGELTLRAPLNFEDPADANADNIYLVQVTANDGAGGIATQNLALTVTNVNEAPANISVSATVISENNAAGAFIGTLSATEPDIGDAVEFSLVAGSGSTDNGSFMIQGNSLKMTSVSDFEAKNTYSIRVQVIDEGGLTLETVFTIHVMDVNEAPRAVSLANAIILLNENTGTDTALPVAEISVDDDALGTELFTLTGPDAGFFQIVAGRLELQPGVILDFETQSLYSVTVHADDTTVGTSPDASATFTLTIADVNEPPHGITFANAVTSLDENVTTATGITLANIVVLDDALGTVSLTLSGADALYFELAGTHLQLKPGVLLNFETQSSYTVTVNADDTTIGSTPDTAADFTLVINDLNEAPTAVTFANTTQYLIENTSTATPTTLADIVVQDDATGNEMLTLSGPDAALFQVVDTRLQLKAGVTLNAQLKSSYSVTIEADDPTVGQTPDAAAVFTLTITPANFAPTDISLSATVVEENQPSGTLVATLASTDPNIGDTFTYSLVPGAGSTNNDRFTIINHQLLTATEFDFEMQGVYLIRVRTSDQTGLTFEKQLAIEIADRNEPPVLSGIAGQFILEDTETGERNFSIGDPETPATALVVTASSSNSGLIPETGLRLTGSGAVRGLNVIPLPNQHGSATIEIVVTDGINSTTTSFVVNVIAINDAPTITTVLPQVILEDHASTPISFTIADIDSAMSGLTVTATSSNAALIAPGGLALQGAGETRNLVVTPTANQSGNAVITLTVGDGQVTTTQEFQITVNAVDDPPFILLDNQPLTYRLSSRQIRAIDGLAMIADVDTPRLNFAGSILRVSGQSPKDRLSILKREGIARKGRQVLFNGMIVGTQSGGKQGNPLTIQLNATATQVSVQALLRSLGFKSLEKSSGSRTLRMQITSENGVMNTEPATRQIELTREG